MQVCEERLRELIEARKEEAESLGIYGMASQVARRLGKESPKKYGSYWFFCRGGLKIIWDDYGSNLDIYYKDQQVFCVHLGDIEAYRPDVGEWLELLRRIYEDEVVPKIEAEEAEKVRELLREAEERWGIKPDEVIG